MTRKSRREIERAVDDLAGPEGEDTAPLFSFAATDGDAPDGAIFHLPRGVTDGWERFDPVERGEP